MFVPEDFDLNDGVIRVGSFCANLDVGGQPEDGAVGWCHDTDNGRAVGLHDLNMNRTGKSRAAKGVHRTSEQSVFACGRIAPHQAERSVLVASQKMVVHIKADTLN